MDVFKKISKIIESRITIRELEDLFGTTYYTTKYDKIPVVRDPNSDVFIFLMKDNIKYEDWYEANKTMKNYTGKVAKNIKDVEKAVKKMKGKGKLFIFNQ